MQATDFLSDLRRMRADYFANPSLERTSTGMALGPLSSNVKPYVPCSNVSATN